MENIKIFGSVILALILGLIFMGGVSYVGNVIAAILEVIVSFLYKTWYYFLAAYLLYIGYLELNKGSQNKK